ncbi:MAG: DNA-3-methyladenine glycosylase 2 family protein [Actinobacteria bacterium]|nr:MAG: DNA-3-methyladenine glycosylase 2 family protein [Actinomycetota bacterium]
MDAAVAHILRADPAFAAVVDAAGPCTLARPRAQTPDDHFARLVGDIIAQQLSTRVAETLTSRFAAALAGQVSPAKVLALDVQEMRAAGLSGAKSRTIRGLAAAVSSGDLDLAAMVADPDPHRVRRDLTALWGIGRWTAEMFEMFTLHRLDVWPVGDLALRRGWAKLHAGATSQPPPDITPAALDPLGDPLRPYRSVAAWYCWRALDAPGMG